MLGHQIDLITYHVGRDVEFPNLKIHRVRKVKRIQHVRIGSSRAKLFLDVLIFFKANWMLLRKRYDVIHTHEEASFIGMFLSWIFRTRHLYDMHSVLSKQLTNFEFGKKSIFVKVFEILEKMVLRTCHAVITVGSDLERYVRSVDPNIRVVMIENIALHAYETQIQPIQVAQLEEKFNLQGRLPVVYTGTYERYQGLDMALECVDIVANKYPNVIFLFVGAKNQQSYEWTEIAKEMKVQDNVRFLDVVSPEESMIFLAYGAVLISPRLEGLTTPLKIYSYLHAGKPIVATNILAHTQVLTSDVALLVEPDKDSFAAGVLQALSDPENARKLGENAHQYALEKFNRKDYISKVNQIYQSFLPGLETEEPAISLE
jgi:glycosyltransferase involved in cell wall biosynthesis